CTGPKTLIYRSVSPTSRRHAHITTDTLVAGARTEPAIGAAGARMLPRAPYVPIGAAWVVDDRVIRCGVVCAEGSSAPAAARMCQGGGPRAAGPPSRTRALTAGSNSDSPLAIARTAFTISPPLISLST